MRGKQPRHDRRRLCIRIIPARAGQTRRHIAYDRAEPDHPRACGANSSLLNNRSPPDGSSPRVRGKPRPASQTARTERIIPARAGQTSMTATMLPPSPDHPRACGANEQEAVEQADQLGSSPRVRGKRYWKGRPSRHRRIIPARAGQTVTGVSIRSPPPDHPRACGANCTRTVSHASRTGSSPRVRGKLLGRKATGGLHRIIPARAGQTPFEGRKYSFRPDHPRACGANPRPVEASSSLIGSSPRVRGKLHVPTAGCGVRRIIPARAGQTPHL